MNVNDQLDDADHNESISGAHNGDLFSYSNHNTNNDETTNKPISVIELQSPTVFTKHKASMTKSDQSLMDAIEMNNGNSKKLLLNAIS
jgi:hypothetical protein